MNIAIVGTGFVGLVTGACLADHGNHVVCMDIDGDRVAQLQNGCMPFYEPGLGEMLERNLSEGRLSFTTDISDAVQESSIVFICVGTPSRDDGSADLESVFDVAEGIADVIQDDTIVVTKSTVPVGTTERLGAMMAARTVRAFHVASNPEFLKEGDAVRDFLKPDRIIVGTDSEHVADEFRALYAPFVRTENPIITMDVRSAEMTKYAANAMLATRISFMNEIANLCESVDADVEMVRKGIGADRRIGYAFIFPGAGYGGSCFPKDVKALAQLGREHGHPAHICEAVDRVNEAQKLRLFEKIHDHFQGDLPGKRVAIWGLSFKPGTSDMREATSVAVIERLLDHGATVMAHDPKANGVAREVFGDRLHYVDDAYEALEGADALALVTEWNEFRTPDFNRIKGAMRSPTVFDGRNIYSPARLRAMGFTYYGIGRR
ncbi:MAG: UDP-glucose/GDP-mannose dehydrogenase family protein [Salinibacter sp.]